MFFISSIRFVLLFVIMHVDSGIKNISSFPLGDSRNQQALSHQLCIYLALNVYILLYCYHCSSILHAPMTNAGLVVLAIIMM